MITLDEQIEYMRQEVGFWIDRLPSTYDKCKAILSTLERVRDEETSTSKLYQDAFQKGMDAMERKTKAIRDATAEKVRYEERKKPSTENPQ